MASEKENRERLARLLNEVAVHEGIHPTRVEGVGVARHSSSIPRTSVVYEPVIVFVGQGRKRSYLGDQVYEYDPATYFALSVPLPAECEWDATPEEPVLVLGSKSIRRRSGKSCSLWTSRCRRAVRCPEP